MIQFDSVSKVFDSGGHVVRAVDNVSFEVPEGEICVLLGPSGCGKTTVLKMVNRLVAPTAGRILVQGQDTSAVDEILLRRSIGYVIQQIGLFPNKTIEENICIVPDLLGWPRAKSRARAEELLSLVALEPKIFLKRYPRELSGGQQQRIGVIRALAADPPVLLMDEPFGAIDPVNRQLIQDEFLKMQSTLRKTILFVSHDLDEAVKMADRIVLMRSGRIEQSASPDEMLARPANAFVEGFVGGDRALRRLGLISVSDLLHTQARTLSPEDDLAMVRHKSALAVQAACPVVDKLGVCQGYIQQSDLQSRSGEARECLRPLPAIVRPSDDLRLAVSLMYAHGVDWLAVIDDKGQYQGILLHQDIRLRLSDTWSS